MSVIFFLILLACVFFAGFLLTKKVIPFLFLRICRLLGFSMKLSQASKKRITRFKRIRRGYYAFLFICTLFVTSLFLELLVNNKALVICYNGHYSFPAVSEWIDQWIPFAQLSYYDRNSDFGLVGDEPVHYRTYKKYCKNPELIKDLITRYQKELQAQKKYIKSLGAAPEKPDPVTKPVFNLKKPVKPAPDASEKKLKEYDVKTKEWEAAREKHLKTHLKEYCAYEEYIDSLNKWKDYNLETKLLSSLEKALPVLEKSYKPFKAGKAWEIMPLYPYGPKDHLLDLKGNPPYSPTWWPYLRSILPGGTDLPKDPVKRSKMKLLPPFTLPLGSTDNGLDVLPQLVYGFRISMVFALIVAAVGYTIGIIVGGIMGYYGGWTDIIIQRFIEIYGSIPFLFTIMIIASIMQPNLILLAVIMIILRSWLGITYYIRGEFYREKAKDYVQSAIGTGVSDWKIITRHIIPNSLVPVVTFAPFGIVAYILSLVSLDYLGFGLPPGSPSWGYLLNQGSQYIDSYPHLILIPSLALAGTLFCVVIIGESVREAFDPKVFSRLR